MIGKKIKRDKLLEDTRIKTIDILNRYHEHHAYLEILQAQIDNLKGLLHTDDLTFLFEFKSKVGIYTGNSVVENEVLYNEREKDREKIKKKLAEQKREEIKRDIERYQLTYNIKKSILLIVDSMLKSLTNDDRMIIKLSFIDKKNNRDKFGDVVDKFNQGRKYILSTSRVEQMKNDAVTKIAMKFKNLQIMNYYKIGE